MHRLWSTIKKDVRILARDKVGLIFMFGLPIILVVIVTTIQNSAFEVVSAKKIPMLVCNEDGGAVSQRFLASLDKAGVFNMTLTSGDAALQAQLHDKVALVGMVIPRGFSDKVSADAKAVAGKALHSFGLGDSSAAPTAGSQAAPTTGSQAEPTAGGATPAGAVVGTGAGELPVTIYEHPILQESFRRSVRGSVGGALQLLESQLVLQEVYRSINDKPLSDSLENTMLNGSTLGVKEVTLTKAGSAGMPNAAQHNVPSWTIFAMFFVVLSLGSSVVREKLNGTFVRLKTLPTNYMVALWSKQLTYLGVTLVQTALIFAIGVWLFPWIGLPVLHLPADGWGLLVVTLICGWCAVSYAICVGVYANTQEQATGFGAISVIILAVIGGLMVPSFVMPDSLKTFMNLSPLHWCLEAYYGLFLEGGRLSDVWVNIIPLLAITLLLQGFIWWGLKRKQLI
jgi:ABC-2 type transport system permease protein